MVRITQVPTYFLLYTAKALFFLGMSLNAINSLFKFLPCRVVQVDGYSMRPTLQANALVLAVRTKQYQPGDIVAAKHPVADYLIVKRIIFTTVRNGKNFFYLIGDDRLSSIDSRHFGLVPEENIVGKVITNVRQQATATLEGFDPRWSVKRGRSDPLSRRIES